MGARYPVDAMALAAARDDVTEAHRALTAAGVPEKLNGFPMKLRTRIDILAERAGVAAGPQATPDQVLWEGESQAHKTGLTTSVPDALGQVTIESYIFVDLDVPPGTRVRVVAVPTDHEDQP